MFEDLKSAARAKWQAARMLRVLNAAALLMILALPVYAELGRNWSRVYARPTYSSSNILEFGDRLWMVSSVPSTAQSQGRSELWSSLDGDNWDKSVFGSLGLLVVAPGQLFLTIDGVMNVGDGFSWNVPDWSTSPQHIVAMTEQPFRGYTWCISYDTPPSPDGFQSAPQYLWHYGPDQQWVKNGDALPWGLTASDKGILLLSTKNDLIVMPDSGSEFRPWRSEDGLSWHQVPLNTSIVNSYSQNQFVSFDGALLAYNDVDWDINIPDSWWKTEDGEIWTAQPTPDIVGNCAGWRMAFRGKLKIMSSMASNGCQPELDLSSVDGIHWDASRGGPFANRKAGFAVATFQSAMWVMGGSTQTNTNEIWRSTDGKQWDLVKPEAEWPARNGATVLVHDGYLWLMGGNVLPEMGGNSAVNLNDVWRSADGLTWELVTAAAPWSPRSGATAVSFNGDILLFGEAETWKSHDGVAWELIADNSDWGFKATPGCVAVFDGTLWATGTPHCNGVDLFYLRLLNSSDGGVSWRDANWSSATDCLSNTDARSGPVLLATDNQLTLIANRWDDEQIIRTSDGVSWNVLTAPWTPTTNPAALVYEDTLWFINTFIDDPIDPSVNEVWKSEITPNFLGYDSNHDLKISLSELLRSIQFYNSDGLYCDAKTEDGYTTDSYYPNTCLPYAADQDHNWKLSISELLRCIQLYTFGAYHPCPEGEDGFCPGAA